MRLRHLLGAMALGAFLWALIIAALVWISGGLD